MVSMKIFLVIVFVLLGLALSAIILMQEGKNQGLGALSGSADSYWQKNRGRSVEGNLEKFTKFAAFAFFAVDYLVRLFPLYGKPAFYAGFFSYPKIIHIEKQNRLESERSKSS